MVRQISEILDEDLGGAAAMATKIAAVIRRRDPDHPIAMAKNPLEELSKTPRAKLLDDLYLLNIPLAEAQGELRLTLDEKRHYAAEGRASVVDVVTLGGVRQQLYVADAIERGSSGFGEVKI